MLNVIYYNHTGQVSGAEKMLLLTLRRLQGAPVRATLLCPAEGTLQEEAAKVGAACETVRTVDARFTWRPDRIAGYLFSIAGMVRLLRARLHAHAPDIVHANSTRAGIIATIASIGMKVPVIWHVHDMLPKHPISTLIRVLAMSSSRTHIVTCSRAAATAFQGRNLVRGKKATVLHNGIEVENYRTNPDHRAPARTELGLTCSDFAIGIVGQVNPRKGHLELVQAFALIAEQVPRAKLLIVGEPIFNRDEEYLRLVLTAAAAAGLRDRVIWVGPKADIGAVMSALDLLVLSSSVEPLGLVILEAMMAGTPVLSTDSGGPGEMIRHGENGHLVPVGDTRKLGVALAQLIRDSELRQKYSAQGPGHVLNHFSAETYMTKLSAIYQDLLPARQKSAVVIASEPQS